MKYIVYAVVLIEVGAAGYWYVTSPYGYAAYQDAVAACCDVQSSISTLDAEITELDTVYDMWENDPFWYEQYARTQLHMGHADERVYMLRT